MLNEYLYAKDQKIINACIFNKEGKLEGCITDEVIMRSCSAMDNIIKKAEQMNIVELVFPILTIMQKMLNKTYENYTADFLNCLKLISQKHRYQLPLEFSQIISRNYHDLLLYCCSNNISDYVFNETINYLRDNELIYQKTENNECLFEYRGINIGIKIAEKSDLYTLWNDKDNEYFAVVYAGNRKYFIIEKSFEILVLAIKACVDDYLQEDEVLNVEFILDDFAKSLLEIAKEIYPQGEYNGFI